MKRFDSVLVGVDFSPSSRVAFEVALAVCGRAGARLELVHVWNPNRLGESLETLPELDTWIDDQKALLVAQLAEWAAEATKSGIGASSRLVEGVASRSIPDLARASRVALVVVGRRGAAGLAHVLLGSVSERVVHLASCPVLVVPEEAAWSRSPSRLMVGVDFSSTSKDAYLTAVGVAEQLRASRGIVLAHVRPDVNERWLADWSELAYRAEYPYDLDSMQRWMEEAGPSHIPVELRLLRGGTERTLVEAARHEACDWLVLGFHGRTALASFLMGSTADRCLKLADRPVLIVPGSSAPAGEPSS